MALVAVSPGLAVAAAPDSTAVPSQMVITAQPVHQGGSIPEVEAGDLTVVEGKTPVPVVRLQRLAGDQADMQLFVLLDDSTRSASLGIQLPELKSYLKSLPATAQVAVGYMQHGGFTLAQAFTADRQKAAHALHLPAAIPGQNGSPYFALSDLVKHWPSKEPAGRRVVLMLTDGVDRYYSTAIVDDPYVDASIRDALKNDVAVYAIYLRGAGFYGRGGWVTTMAQSRLSEVSQETGGYAYFQGFTDPVTIAPFLNDFRGRLENQYKVTFEALNERGVQPVKLRTELPGLKIVGPSRFYVR
ncbi:MAG: hypothetical protein ACLQVN_11260 [Bryobacteraceae bacterium]